MKRLICPVCKQPVNAIFSNPLQRNELVVGPHDKPYDQTAPGRYETCPGSGQQGVSLDATEAARN